MPSMNPSSLGQSDLIGGYDYNYFNDLDKMMNNNGQLNLDSRRPIKQVKVMHGWVVDGICTTYGCADGNTIQISRGSPTSGNCSTVDLKDTEIVSSVFGRAGRQDYYKRDMINCIGFTIFDRATCQSRTVGPFGNGNNSNNGEPFNIGELVAFAGYSKDGAPDLGLSGFYFILRPAGSSNLNPVRINGCLRSGAYNTMEVRDWQKLSPDTRKTIQLQPPYCDGQLPRLACGLNWIDESCAANIRVRALIESVSRDSFVCNVQSWSDSQLFSGGVTWLDVPVDRGLQYGIIPQQWTVRDAAVDKSPYCLANIVFDRAYAKPPTVICWLAGIDMDKAKNWRMKTYATNVTMTGCSINVETWFDSKMYGSSVCWIAVPDGARDIVVGKYEGNTNSQTGQVTFPNKLSRKPGAVCMALSAIDFQTGLNLRVKTSVENVTESGFKFNMNTWGNSIMHWAECTYIAIADSY